MPEKNPDIWMIIWLWLQANANTVQGVVAALVMSLLRMGFMRKKRTFLYNLLDAAICASIASAVISAGAHFFGHSEYSQFIGVMIGFIGTEKIREFLFKFINRRVNQYDRFGGYDDNE